MTSTSVHQKFSGLLIVIGSLVFVCGGAFHPRINSSLGALGSTEFFQNFYMHIAHHGSWRLIHGMILVGPVLWLLGIGSLWSGRNGWTRMATTAMTLAATAWAVTFVFDGFVAPDIVRWLTPETGWHVLAVNQDVVIRLGLVSPLDYFRVADDTPGRPSSVVPAIRRGSVSQNHRPFAIRDQCACNSTHLDPRTSNGSSIPILRSAGR